MTLGLPWTAITLAAGIAQIVTINKQAKQSIADIKGAGASLPSGGGGDSAGGGGESMPSLPSTGGGGSLPETGGGGAAPSLGEGGGGESNGGGGGSGGAVRAYVVERDISDAQSRDAEIQNRARFE